MELAAIEEGIYRAGEPGVALDIGCDGGRWSKLIAGLGWKIIATDVNSAAVDLCHQRIPDAHCIRVDPTNRVLPVESNAVKLVLMIEVFEIMHDEWLLAEVSRVLLPGGIMIATCPNRCSWRGLYSRFKGDADFWYKDSYKHWVARLRGNNLEIIKSVGFTWPPFRRNSDSKLVPLAIRLEKHLGLSHLTSLSPWVLALARKRLVPAAHF
jgi:SAM-dependent methyltransferase